MPIQRGSQKIIKRHRGSQEILASYRSDQLVWQFALPRYVYTEEQNDTGIFISIPAQNTWHTLTSGTTDNKMRATEGHAQAEWTRNWGDQTYGIRFIVNGTQTAYQQVQGGGGTNVYQGLIIPEQQLPPNSTWAVQVRTSDPYNNQNRRIRRAALYLY